MDRLCGWSPEEVSYLAKSWVCSTEDYVEKLSQSDFRFWQRFHQCMIEMGPPQWTITGKRFSMLSPSSCETLFEDLTKDCKRFQRVLRMIRDEYVSKQGYADIEALAIDIHIGNKEKTKQPMEERSQEIWKFYNAWKILRIHPKWSGFQK